MRAPDVVKATDAGASNFCSIRAVLVAIAAATMQATMKTRMFVFPFNRLSMTKLGLQN